MRSSAKTALGIDVAGTQVNMAMLRKVGDRIAVVKTAQVPISDEIMSNGHVVDPAGFARLLKATRKRYGIRAGGVAVSLPAAETLVRVIPLEEDDPQRIAQVVSDELKQYAFLSGRETTSDFRVITPARHAAPGRVLIGASDQNTVVGLSQVCHNARLRVHVVEPAIMACLRVLHSIPDVQAAADNLMAVLLKDGTMTICPFRKKALDLVRTRAIADVNTEPGAVYKQAADEINTVMRSYQMGTGVVPQNWTVVLIDDDNVFVGEDVRQGLAERLAAVTLRVLTRTDPLGDIETGQAEEESVSLTALGLALRLLGPFEEEGLCINLIPPEDPGSDLIRGHLCVTAAVLSMLVLLMLTATHAFGLISGRVDQGILARRQEKLDRGYHTLGVAATEMFFVEQRITSLSDELGYLSRIADVKREVDWTGFLTDLKGAVPELLSITNLYTRGDSEVIVQGLSFSYDDVYVFAQVLSESAHIHRASIDESGRDDRLKSLVHYTVRCVIRPGATR